MREGMDRDVGQGHQRAGGVQPHHPAAVAQVERDPCACQDERDRVDQPVQRDVDAAPPGLPGRLRPPADAEGAEPREAVAVGETPAHEVDEIGRDAEEQGQAGHEMDGPDLSLREHRRQELRGPRHGRVGRDAQAGEQARHHGDSDDPVDDDRPDIGARMPVGPRGGRAAPTGGGVGSAGRVRREGQRFRHSFLRTVAANWTRYVRTL